MPTIRGNTIIRSITGDNIEFLSSNPKTGLISTKATQTGLQKERMTLRDLGQPQRAKTSQVAELTSPLVKPAPIA